MSDILMSVPLYVIYAIVGESFSHSTVLFVSSVCFDFDFFFSFFAFFEAGRTQEDFPSDQKRQHRRLLEPPQLARSRDAKAHPPPTTTTDAASPTYQPKYAFQPSS